MDVGVFMILQLYFYSTLTSRHRTANDTSTHKRKTATLSFEEWLFFLA